MTKTSDFKDTTKLAFEVSFSDKNTQCYISCDNGRYSINLRDYHYNYFWKYFDSIQEVNNFIQSLQICADQLESKRVNFRKDFCGRDYEKEVKPEPTPVKKPKWKFWK